MEQFVVKDGKQLRLGYTTGSCAAAAAKAAGWMLLTGREKKTIGLHTPKGIDLTLHVEEITRGADFVSCAIAKDAGDDPDVTAGALIFARVALKASPGVDIDGGFGVGRVTKPGLDQSVGNAAINSVPRAMIRENLLEIARELDYPGGFTVEISVPLGEELAKKTFNPRLGIVGGISILGTTGIVEPMSEQALVDTIRVELRQKRTQGDYVLLTPGNYGSDFIRDSLKIDPKTAVQVSNFIGVSLDICKELEFKGALLIEAGGRHDEYPLEVRRLPHGDPLRHGRGRGGGRRNHPGHAGVRQLRRLPAPAGGPEGKGPAAAHGAHPLSFAISRRRYGNRLRHVLQGVRAAGKDGKRGGTGGTDFATKASPGGSWQGAALTDEGRQAEPMQSQPKQFYSYLIEHNCRDFYLLVLRSAPHPTRLRRATFPQGKAISQNI